VERRIGVPELAQGADQPADERGFTLIELVVSLTILAIGIVGVIGVMNSSFGVAVRTNERSRAVNLATKELEALRAVEYATLIPTGTTETRTEKVGGTTFTIEKAVTWVAQGSNATAVKRATVAIRWSSGGGINEVAQATVIYPGGLGPVAPASTSSCGSGGTPSGPIALGAGAPGILTENAVDLAWTPPASSSPAVATWKIEMSTDNFATSQVLTSSHPVSSLVYRAENLSANTTYKFRVAGVSACGNASVWSPIATVQTLAAAVIPSCTLGSSTVSPTGVKRANNGNSAGLAVTTTVTVNTTGSCAGLYIKYQAVTGTWRTQQLVATGGVWRVNLTSTGPWDIGVHTIDIYDGANVKRGSLLLTICAHNASSCG
jgi:type IV pilus assembly protein PilV